jgi:hypothetical protein
LSASADLKLKMTNSKAIERMCDRCGFSLVLWKGRQRVTEHEGATSVTIDLQKNGNYRTQFTVDLSGQRSTEYDSDFRRHFFRQIFDREMTAEEKKEIPVRGFKSKTLADDLIGEWVEQQYEVATAITAAEELGWQWQEGQTLDGVPTIECIQTPTEEAFAPEFN